MWLDEYDDKEKTDDHTDSSPKDDWNPLYQSDNSHTKSKTKSLAIFAIVFSFAVVAFLYVMSNGDIDVDQSNMMNTEQNLIQEYGVGSFGSDHAHAALVLFLDGQRINFGLPQYQLQSKYVHFENNNPYLVHRHATEVPLKILFNSIGLDITQNCIVVKNTSDDPFAEKKELCEGDELDYSLQFYINGQKYGSDISEYVFEHNDRILISLGDYSGESIQEQLEYLESLTIHDVPKEENRDLGDNISV